MGRQRRLLWEAEDKEGEEDRLQPSRTSAHGDPTFLQPAAFSNVAVLHGSGTIKDKGNNLFYY